MTHAPQRRATGDAGDYFERLERWIYDTVGQEAFHASTLAPPSIAGENYARLQSDLATAQRDNARLREALSIFLQPYGTRPHRDHCQCDVCNARAALAQHTGADDAQ